MKQIVLTFAILLTLVVTVNAKSVVKDTDSFTISTLEASNTNVHASWMVEYSTEANNIEVFKVKTKKGEDYIVRNTFFEVRYTNTNKGFGVKAIKNNQRKVDATLTQAVINTDEMQKQSILSSKKLSEEKALSYIAGFVPYLLNDNYKHLLN